MAFWSNWFRSERAAEDLPKADSPGDPNGVELAGEETFSRAGFPMLTPSPWDGWPANWATQFQSAETGLRKLVDTAWACLDLNSSVLSSMPVYGLADKKITEPRPWMLNPDPLIYTSWNEFAKQLFWDYMCGEAFVLSMAEDADGLPMRMRVIPPWLVQADLSGGSRVYTIGSRDVTNEICHIRYHSSIDNARGFGPLDAAGARITTAGLLQRYARQLAETGGVPHYWLGLERWVNQQEADELLQVWIESRRKYPGQPAVASGGSKLNSLQSMNAKDMALLELAQFTESRIAILLGVPPFLVGLPSGGDSMTYSNISQLFDFHDRSSLRPKAGAVMSALTNWAMGKGECVELNRDEYSRPDFASRIAAYKALMDTAAESGDQNAPAEVWAMVRTWERFHGPEAAAALSGNTQVITQPSAQPTPEGSNNVSRIGYRNGR